MTQGGLQVAFTRSLLTTAAHSFKMAEVPVLRDLFICNLEMIDHL